MSSENLALRALDDEALILSLKALVAQERESTADVIEHLIEVERRGLHYKKGFPSSFAYCRQVLGYSESESYLRIRAARAAITYPRVLEDLRSGKLTLDAVARLSPHLNAENCDLLLESAAGASKREVLGIVATLSEEPAPERDIIVPVAPDRMTHEPEVVPALRHRFHFTADGDLLKNLDRLKGYLRHKYPEGRMEDILKEATDHLLNDIQKELEKESRPRKASKRSRIVPNAIKREVWKRDGGRCTFVSEDGKRCDSQEALEYDHKVPWAEGGRSDLAENIRLLCRPHNQWEGRKKFGDYRREAGN